MEKFGRYVLLEHVATGGMAEVHRAVALGTAGFARPVAIKRIAPHLMADPDAVRLLIEEAKLAASLSHPNIIRVSDLGVENGRYYLAMDFVAGQSLSNVVAAARDRGIRLPLPLVMHLAREALRGLAYVHHKRDFEGRALDLIHRDVSPQNIMVTYDGAVLLVDFGIARAAQRAVVTRDGILRGKPSYMSPDVVNGGPVTQGADLYALAVTLHELITLRPMRIADTQVQLLAEVMAGHFPRFEDMHIRVPEDVADLIYRALAPDPAERPADAARLGNEVEALMNAHGWVMDDVAVRAFMRELFQDAIARETQTQAHFHRLVQEGLRGGAPANAAVTAPVDPFCTAPAITPPAAVVRRRASAASKPARAVATIFGAGALMGLVGWMAAGARTELPSLPAALAASPELTSAEMGLCESPIVLVEDAAAGQPPAEHTLTTSVPLPRHAAPRSAAPARRPVLPVRPEDPFAEAKPKPPPRRQGLGVIMDVADEARRALMPPWRRN